MLQYIEHNRLIDSHELLSRSGYGLELDFELGAMYWVCCVHLHLPPAYIILLYITEGAHG
jgi:hypothetical protein